MCTNYRPTTVCQVADLTNGDKYHDPRTNDNFMLVAGQVDDCDDGFSMAVSLNTGVVLSVRNDIKLADRGDGRLYASRTLNGWEGGWQPAPVVGAVPTTQSAT